MIPYIFPKHIFIEWLIFRLTCLDLISFLHKNNIFLYGRIQSSQTGNQLYSKISPYKVSFPWFSPLKEYNQALSKYLLQQFIFDASNAVTTVLLRTLFYESHLNWLMTCHLRTEWRGRLKRKTPICHWAVSGTPWQRVFRTKFMLQTV